MMLCKKGTEADIQRYGGKWLGSGKIDGIRCIAICNDDKGLMALTEDGLSVQVWGYHANDVRTSIDLLGFCRAEISYFTEGDKDILRNVYLNKILPEAELLPSLIKKSA